MGCWQLKAGVQAIDWRMIAHQGAYDTIHANCFERVGPMRDSCYVMAVRPMEAHHSDSEMIPTKAIDHC